MDQGAKIYMALQLCQAIMFMHSNVPPIAHLDIKPSNILVRSCMGIVIIIIKLNISNLDREGNLKAVPWRFWPSTSHV